MDRFTKILLAAVLPVAVFGSIAAASNYQGEFQFGVKSDGVELRIDSRADE